MNSTLKYKGFTSRVQFSADDGVFVGRVLGIDDIVVFHGQSVAELKKEFKELVVALLDSVISVLMIDIINERLNQ